jgi:hypothetical protein
MRQDNVLQFNPAYEAWIAEEETKPRWLIARHPGSRELAYYLIFLFLGNEQYSKSLVECRRVLEDYPWDVVARMWKEVIHLRWYRFSRDSIHSPR